MRSNAVIGKKRNRVTAEDAGNVIESGMQLKVKEEEQVFSSQ